ncbi:MAG: B12-binding domain-containing radical SAM protein [Polyangiales bacterium]
MRHSIASGDVVLCNPPPYGTQPWLSMGVVLHHTLLADAGMRARVVRPLDAPFEVPSDIGHATNMTLTFDPTMEERLGAMERATPAFFERVVDDLLAGGESIVALSLFRNNSDVALHLARKIKERKPRIRVVLGGPEAIENPAALLQPWVDAVVGLDAEASMVPLMRALLDGDVPSLRNVWTHAGGDPRTRAPLPTPPMPTIDYSRITPLLQGDPEATVPMLMNWGCPYHCAYCSNRFTYGRFTQGSIERVIEEMDQIVATWRSIHQGAAPGLGLQLSDATTNAIPGQFDALLEVVRDRIPHWGMRPFLRGQTLFDARITKERVRLWDESGFHSTFFGLDGADDSMRKSLKRPGSLDQVREAVRTYVESGQKGLTFGVPVGLPGETEERFEESVRFVEWVLSLGGGIESITVLPYLMFRSAQEPSLLSIDADSPRGVLWRGEGPSGDPRVRAHRFMRLFDVIDGRVPVFCPIPPYLFLPAMLPDEPERVAAWIARHGRSFDQITPRKPAPTLPRGTEWERAEKVMRAASNAAWAFEQLEWRPEALVAVFRQGDRRVAVLLERREPARRSFAFTRDFNVSYLKEWRGSACIFDAGFLRARVEELRRSESG